MEVEFVGQGARDDDDPQRDPSRLINCYRENADAGFTIKSVLGTEEFATLTGVFMREMEEVGGKIYAAHGGNLYRVSEEAVVTSIATITDADDTTISGNNGSIAVAAGSDYFVVDADGVQGSPSVGALEIDGAPARIGSVDFIGQRSIVTEKGGNRRIAWSDPTEPGVFNALNFATAEYSDDSIIRGAVINGQYWVFGERSIELWYLTRSSDVAQFIQPMSGAAKDTGLKSFGLFTKFDNAAFFIGNDNIVYLASAGQMIPISIRPVETAIKQADPSRCFFYEDEAHRFCVIQFKDRPAWCFDVVSKEWHERAEGDFDPWTAVAAVKAYGESFVGTQLGGIYKLVRNNADVGQPLIRRAVSRTLELEGNPFRVSKVELRPSVGRSNLGRDAQMMFRASKDRGQTYGRERWRSLGGQGEYEKRVIVRSFGQFYKFNLEVVASDPTNITINTKAFVEVA